MTNFRINFERPWLLLLLVPAIALSLWSYFKLGKRYRRTRNRIVSVTLHIIVMVLSIAVLAGMTFSFYKPNTENEVILLVDASYSTNEDTGDKVDNFVKEVIDNSHSTFKLGIVTFGYTQVYAAELTNDTNKLYSKYLEAPLPDTTATDLASAITFAASCFEKPSTARIVLLSDAIETDNSVRNVIKSVAAEGIKVDTVHFAGNDVDNEVQIIDMTVNDEKILVGTKFTMTLKVQSSFEDRVSITPYDNDVDGAAISVDIKEGINEIVIPFEFSLPGMHELAFEIESNRDTVEFNNVYRSYIYLEIFDDILIIEGVDGNADKLTDLLHDELNVKLLNADEVDKIPKTVDELRAYDEVILCNVANDQLPEGFDKILYSYVHDFGGGLFTVCGNEQDNDPNDDNWTANAYTREDMKGTLYQEMLPVEIINYTPPAAVMIIVDVSGSMFGGGTDNFENSKLDYALEGARACLDSLTERDYAGIMTLSTNFTEEVAITPRTQRDKILAAITKIEEDAKNDLLGGGTIFSGAIERAGKALAAMTGVEKKHIMIVTDGAPADSDKERYQYWFEENAKNGITASIVGIQCSTSAQYNMEQLLVNFAKVDKSHFHNVDEVQNTPTIMREDLELPEIKEANYSEFTPKIYEEDSLVFNKLEIKQLPSLHGYYGVKLKEGATTVISGDYTPIYAEWQFGKGRVGTFACDLNGVWSAEFLEPRDDIDTVMSGPAIINNIITSLFPTESIKPSDIDAEWTGDNYATQLSVYTTLGEDEYVEATITSHGIDGSEPTVQTLSAGAKDGYSRMTFSVTTPGMHTIYVCKKDKDGNVLSEKTIYKMLSYSKEYDMFTDKNAAAKLSALISESTDGEVIVDPIQVFENAAKYIHRIIDPRIVFMITSIVLFLLDIAARKFKWKWPHEIVRDKRNKAMSSK